MKIYLSPTVPPNSIDRIKYEFEEDIIKVTLPDGTNDTFDFSEFPDGELQVYDENGNSLIQSELSDDVILSAKKEDGILYVELENYIGPNAPDQERFPEWIDHTEYVPAKEEPEIQEETPKAVTPHFNEVATHNPIPIPVESPQDVPITEEYEPNLETGGETDGEDGLEIPRAD